MLLLATLLASSARLDTCAVLLLATLLASVACRFGGGGGMSMVSSGGDDSTVEGRVPDAAPAVAAGRFSTLLAFVSPALELTALELLPLAPLGRVEARSVLVPFLREKPPGISLQVHKRGTRRVHNRRTRQRDCWSAMARSSGSGTCYRTQTKQRRRLSARASLASDAEKVPH